MLKIPDSEEQNLLLIIYLSGAAQLSKIELKNQVYKNFPRMNTSDFNNWLRKKTQKFLLLNFLLP